MTTSLIRYLFFKHWDSESLGFLDLEFVNACLLYYLCSKEAVGKESEDKRIQATLSPEQDDISLFYSDIMPLLVSKFLCVETWRWSTFQPLLRVHWLGWSWTKCGWRCICVFGLNHSSPCGCHQWKIHVWDSNRSNWPPTSLPSLRYVCQGNTQVTILIYIYLGFRLLGSVWTLFLFFQFFSFFSFKLLQLDLLFLHFFVY